MMTTETNQINRMETAAAMLRHQTAEIITAFMRPLRVPRRLAGRKVGNGGNAAYAKNRECATGHSEAKGSANAHATALTPQEACCVLPVK